MTAAEGPTVPDEATMDEAVRAAIVHLPQTIYPGSVRNALAAAAPILTDAAVARVAASVLALEGQHHPHESFCRSRDGEPCDCIFYDIHGAVSDAGVERHEQRIRADAFDAAADEVRDQYGYEDVRRTAVEAFLRGKARIARNGGTP